MRILLNPILMSTSLQVIKHNDALEINGETFDFTSLQEGDEVSWKDVPCDFIQGSPIRRIHGEIELTLLLPYNDPGEPFQWFPKPLERVPNGRVDLPRDTVDTVETYETETEKVTVTTYDIWHHGVHSVVTKVEPKNVAAEF